MNTSNLKSTLTPPPLKSEADYHRWVDDFNAYLATQNMLKVTRDDFKPPGEDDEEYEYKLESYNHIEERYYGAQLIALSELPTFRSKVLKAYAARKLPLPRGTVVAELIKHEIMENPLSARYSSISISADQFTQGLLALPDAINHLDSLWQRLPDNLQPSDRAKIMRLRGALHREWVDSIKTMTLANMAMTYEEVCAGLLTRYYENLADKAHRAAENDSAHAADTADTDDDDGDDNANYAHDKRGRDRDRDYRGQKRGIRNNSRDRDHRGSSRERYYRGDSKERSYRSNSQDRSRRGYSQERDYRNDYRGRGQYDRDNYRGHSQDRGNQRHHRSPSPYVNHRKADFRGGKRRSFSRSPYRDQRQRGNTPPPGKRRVSFIRCFDCGEEGHKAGSNKCGK